MATTPARTMAAAVLTALPADGLEVRQVPVPRPTRDDDVVLRVEACGICGTDLHILDGQSYRPELPFVLGHEPVGVVVDAGAAAQEWLDRRVTLTLFTGDGTCPACLAGDERLCPRLRSITGVLAVDGAYAEYVRVHARQLVAVPEGLGAEHAASLVDAGATAANSVRVSCEAQTGNVLVIGAGPIGWLVAELLRHDRVAHVVVEPNGLRRVALANAGHDVVSSFDEVAGAVDAVIDCSGAAAAMAPAIELLGPHGRYVLAGYARVPDFDFGEVSHREIAILGVRSGRRDDLERILALAAAGLIVLPELSTWPLDRIDDALRALRSGAVAGKAVIIPDPLWKE